MDLRCAVDDSTVYQAMRMILGAGVWTYVVVAIMLVAAIVLLRAMLVPANVSFAKREQLLSDDQKRLYQALLVWAGDRWVIFCKVPVIAVVQPRGSLHFRKSWFESLSQHQIDFLLCDPLTTRISVAISLIQGSNGSRTAPPAATGFVADVLKGAGVRWLAIPAKSRYSAEEIQRLVGTLAS